MAKQPYNTTMSWQQLIAAVNADMMALYADVAGVVTSVGITPGSADITSTGGPITGAGNITIDLSAAVKSDLTLASSALQSVSVEYSIAGAGTVASPLELSGDVATPGNSYYYGTNASGTKSWYASTTKGTFTGTLTGMSGTTTGSFNYTVSGDKASIYLTANITGTSNSTSLTVTGIPAALTPANPQLIACANIENNSAGSQVGYAYISGTTITIYLISGTTITSTGFTASGTKGLQGSWSLTYPLQ